MASLELSSAQRKRLRGLAHELKPVVTVGRAGLSDGAIHEIDHALASHELIKVRLGEGSDQSKAERRELCASLAARLDACFAGIVGHVAVLYRPAADPEDRRIRI